MKSNRGLRIILLFGLLQIMILLGMGSIIGSILNLKAHQQFAAVLFLLSYCIAAGVGLYSFYELRRLDYGLNRWSQTLEMGNENTLRQLGEIKRLISEGMYEYAARYIDAVAVVKRKQDKLDNRKTFEELLFEEYAQLAEVAGVALEIDQVCDSVNTYMTYKEFSSLVGNLLDNALKALSEVDVSEHKWIKVFTDLCSENYFILEVSNSHQTLLKEHLEKILEPGFTTKKEEGHGYGMSVVQDIVKKLDGVLEIETEPETRFRVLIPIS